MAKAKKQFKTAVTATRNAGLSILIPTEEITEAQLRQMAKQRKAAGIGSVGRPRRNDKDNANASAAERGTKPGEMRKTYLVNIDHAEKLDRIAYWNRISIKDAVATALQAYVNDYEKKNGPVKPIPNK